MKPVLLDTNALIFTFAQPKRLPSRWRTLLEDGNQTVLVSAVCLWEIAIKAEKASHGFTIDAEVVMQNCLEKDIGILTITAETSIQSARLPFHHRDPFDRFIIAQAQASSAAVMTTDRIFSLYDVSLISA